MYIIGYSIRSKNMNTVTLTAKGQCTFKKSLLEHMGIKPGNSGQKLIIKKLPDGSLKIQANATYFPLQELQGCIRTNAKHSEEDIQNAIAQAYAKSGSSGLKQS